jgi:hypothetical protein
MNLIVARLGAAWQGWARQGEAGQGEARQGFSSFPEITCEGFNGYDPNRLFHQGDFPFADALFSDGAD